MATRSDVIVDFPLSPRIAEVLTPSVEMTMQDLVDTLRKREDAFRGMSEDKLLNASGKESLGGGVLVGITVALQNTLLAFQGRTTPAQVGTVTAVPASPVISRQIMQDSAATFITNGVQRGSLLINFTDQSVADVVSVDSETQLTTKVLIEGLSNTYTITDDYKVWNIIQVSATGGNLTAVDELQGIIAPILPTAFTQVVLTASSSATLSESQDIQYASFNGAVTVDITNETGNAVSGTTFPAGTERNPSDNFVDALAIAQARGFFTFHVISDAVIDSALDFTDFRFIGQGQNLTMLTLATGATFVNTTYMDATVTGTLDGDAHIEDCIVQNLNFVSGVIENCILDSGTITLGGSQVAHFVNCASGVPGASTPVIDMGGSGQALAMRNYNGGIELRNKSGLDAVSIDMNSGNIVLASSVTNGPLTLRGIGKVTDNSAGATVINEVLSAADMILARDLMQADQFFDKSLGLLHYYFKGTTTDIIPAKTVSGEQVATDVNLVE